MLKKVKKIPHDYIIVGVGLLLSLLFLLLDSLAMLPFLRGTISFVMSPLEYQGNNLGRSSREYLETFVYLKNFRDEYNEMCVDIYEKEVLGAFYSVLEEENEALRKQISLGGDQSQHYVLAKVLSNPDYDFLRINKGEKDKITVGDVVMLGNMYVGMVARVDRQGALVKTALNKGSNLEVVVIRSDIKESKTVGDINNILTKGVVKGSSDGMKIENMSMNASIKEDDIVVINDSKVGQYLILGYLANLSDNPAATSRSGYVLPIVEYDNLFTVFVKTDF